MFDELILNAGSKLSAEQRALDPQSVKEAAKVGPPEVEIHEYHQLASQVGWFKANYPDLSRIKGLDVPLISGPRKSSPATTAFSFRASTTTTARASSSRCPITGLMATWRAWSRRSS